MSASGKVFVTGATGFVGSHVARLLHGAGYDVFAMTRKSPDRAAPPQLESLPISWIHVESATDAMRRNSFDAVIHLATEYGHQSRMADCVNANVSLPLTLLQAAAENGCSLFINTDSFFGKGAFAYPYMRPYTLSKQQFAQWGSYSASQESIQFVTLRLEHVYGEHDGKAKFVPSLIHKLLASQNVPLTTGQQRRDFVHAQDVANAYLTLLRTARSGASQPHEMEVGLGHSVSVKDFVELAKSLTGSHSVLEFGAVPMRQHEIVDSHANDAPLRNLGWSPQVMLHEGLSRTIASIRSELGSKV